MEAARNAIFSSRSVVSAEDWAALLAALYGAATDAQLWPAFIDKLSSCLGGPATLVYGHGVRNQPQLVSANFDPQAQQSYAEYFGDKNPYAENQAQWRRLGAVLDARQIIAEEDLRRTEYYNDWLRPQDIAHGAIAQIQDETDDYFDIAIDRSERRGGFADDELQLLHDLLPHVRQVVNIANRLDVANRAAGWARATLDSLGGATILVDADHTLLSASSEAEEVLSSGLLRVGRGKIAGASLSAEAGLKAAIAAATDRDAAVMLGQPVLLGRNELGDPVAALVLPVGINHGAPWSQPLAALIIGTGRRSPARPEVLQSVYNLTASQARLVAALGDGQTIAEYSNMAGIRLSTAKTHLATAFQKLRETKQSGIVRRLLDNPIFSLASES